MLQIFGESRAAGEVLWEPYPGSRWHPQTRPFSCHKRGKPRGAHAHLCARWRQCQVSSSSGNDGGACCRSAAPASKCQPLLRQPEPRLAPHLLCRRPFCCFFPSFHGCSLVFVSCNIRKKKKNLTLWFCKEKPKQGKGHAFRGFTRLLPKLLLSVCVLREEADRQMVEKPQAHWWGHKERQDRDFFPFLHPLAGNVGQQHHHGGLFPPAPTTKAPWQGAGGWWRNPHLLPQVFFFSPCWQRELSAPMWAR